MTGSLQLHEYPGEVVRLSCPKCGRAASLLESGSALLLQLVPKTLFSECGPLLHKKRLRISQSPEEGFMRAILLGLLAAAGIAIATPVVPASAQVTVDTPVGGVTVGHRHRAYRDYDYDSPRYRGYARYGGCRTVTITRDDGSFKRIRRCG